jgi:hypothetical protein
MRIERANPRCEAIASHGKQCLRESAGPGTGLCTQHHLLKFGNPKRTMVSGAIAGRPGYLGSHGHLNR